MNNSKTACQLSQVFGIHLENQPQPGFCGLISGNIHTSSDKSSYPNVPSLIIGTYIIGVSVIFQKHCSEQ